MDIVSPKTRSRMMSGIRGKNTRPEIHVRRALYAAGLRFRLHRRDLPGVPDILLPKHRVAIFVHGCFWHLHGGCRYSKLPSTRANFWREKLDGNRQRDSKNVEKLLDGGWRVLLIWECFIREIARDADISVLLAEWINGMEITGEFPKK